MKIIAYYLPQFHEIKENNEWWGEGFTEWSNMKKATPLIENHFQPRIPLNNNYYNLLDKEVMRWQINLAKEYGVYGFCVYHYWFDGKLLLEKPMENLLEDKSLDIPFFFCWANDPWTNIWKGESDSLKTLIMNHYSDPKDWEKHFYYFLKFFKDSRYLKENNKPILTIYNPALIKKGHLSRMLKLWNELAIKNGFDGMVYAYQSANSFMAMGKSKDRLFNYCFEYVPPLVAWKKKNKFELIKYRTKIAVGQFLRNVNKKLLDKKTPVKQSYANSVKIMRNYDEEWNDVISFKPKDFRTIPGAFVDWDNTPRYQRNGKLLIGANPNKFKRFLIEQINRAKDIYKKDVIVFFAWNEWSEGGYLEPDSRFGYSYLEAIKSALIETNEFPSYDDLFSFSRDK